MAAVLSENSDREAAIVAENIVPAVDIGRTARTEADDYFLMDAA